MFEPIVKAFLIILCYFTVMEIKVDTTHPIAHIFTIAGELDMYNAGDLKASIGSRMESMINNFIFDASKIEYIDSTGLSVFVMLFTKLRPHKKRLVLTGLQEQVSKIFSFTSLTGLIPIKDSVSDAIDFLEKQNGD
jgi:anti-sigma B factor antagonist